MAETAKEYANKNRLALAQARSSRPNTLPKPTGISNSEIAKKAGLDFMRKEPFSGKPLEQQLRGKVGAQLGGAVGGAIGSYIPVAGTAAGKVTGSFFGRIAAESKVGKWVTWGTIAAIIISCLIGFLIVGGIVVIILEKFHPV